MAWITEEEDEDGLLTDLATRLVAPNWPALPRAWPMHTIILPITLRHATAVARVRHAHQLLLLPSLLAAKSRFSSPFATMTAAKTQGNHPQSAAYTKRTLAAANVASKQASIKEEPEVPPKFWRLRFKKSWSNAAFARTGPAACSSIQRRQVDLQRHITIPLSPRRSSQLRAE